jgi:hypothetical protein
VYFRILGTDTDNVVPPIKTRRLKTNQERKKMINQNEYENTKVVGTRVKHRFAQIMDICSRQDACKTRSEFIRAALKEKLQRDVPDLYNRYLKGAD